MRMLEKIRESRLTKWVFPAAIITITVLATLDSGHLPETPIKSDKINHILAFGTLAFLAEVSYPQMSLFRRIAILVAYGFLLEFIQCLLPWRSCEVSDVVADVVGIVLFIGFWEILKIIKEYKHDSY